MGFIVGKRGPLTDSATLTSYGGGITGREGEAMEFYNSQVNLLQPFSSVTGLERTAGSAGRHGGMWVGVGSRHGERVNCRYVSEWVGIPVERTHLFYRDRCACCQIHLEVCLVLCAH